MPPKRGAQKRKSTLQDDVDTDSEQQEQTTTNKRSCIAGIAGDKLLGSSKLKDDLAWYSHDDPDTDGKTKVPAVYYLYSSKLEGREKIAAFDIDFTVICTKSGKSFPTNANDWVWFDKCVPAKLKELHENGFRVVFISNQAGIEKGKVKFSELKTKNENMIEELGIPVYVLLSTGETHYRKPSSEMWTFLCENLNNNVKVDLKQSFYIGDAAGRVKNWAPGKKKDFSCSDRMFAHNCGIDFQTPEEFFLGHKKISQFEWGSIDPNEILKKHQAASTDESYYSTEQEIVLLNGPPASGKSTFYNRHLKSHNYLHVNRDTLQTPAKCLKATEDALKEGKSVCVDNTNPSKASRAEYISLANKYKCKIRCFQMQTDIELCHHLNYVRQNQTKSKVRRIPDVGYNMYKSQYEEPKLAEGFSEIKSIKFHPKFDSPQHEQIFKQWTS